MIWLIELALVLLLVGGGWTMMNKGRHTDQREALTMRRVDAYIETIRRERRNSDLMDMSDTELRDLLHAGARSLRAAEQKKGWTLLGIGAATLVAASVMAGVEGWMGFGVTAALGATVTYGASEFLNRRMRAPLERRGIDVERLRVE